MPWDWFSFTRWSRIPVGTSHICSKGNYLLSDYTELLNFLNSYSALKTWFSYNYFRTILILLIFYSLEPNLCTDNLSIGVSTTFLIWFFNSWNDCRGDGTKLFVFFSIIYIPVAEFIFPFAIFACLTSIYARSISKSTICLEESRKYSFVESFFADLGLSIYTCASFNVPPVISSSNFIGLKEQPAGRRSCGIDDKFLD